MSATAAYRQFLQDLEEKRGWYPTPPSPSSLSPVLLKHVIMIKKKRMIILYGGCLSVMF